MREYVLMTDSCYDLPDQMAKDLQLEVLPLTRWQYFTKTLYHDPSKTQEFEYDGVIYLKSQELQDIEERNARVNWVLLLVLCAMFLTAIKWQNIVVIAVGMVVIVAGELFRMSRLPKDIKAHLTDSGRRKL